MKTVFLTNNSCSAKFIANHLNEKGLLDAIIIEEKSNSVELSDKCRNELSPDNPDNFIIPDLGEIFHDFDKSNIDSKKKTLKKC